MGTRNLRNIGAKNAALKVGTLAVPIGEIILSNANSVSFGFSGRTLTLSISPPGGVGGVSISAGTSNSPGGQIVFADSNGLAFGNNGGTITGSYTTPVQSIQTQNSLLVQGSSGSIVFANSNNIVWGFTNSIVTASATFPAQSVQTQSLIAALYDGANSISTGTIRVSDANGVTFSINGQTLSASVRTDYASSNHSHGNPTLALTNLAGTTASNSAGFTLSLSHNISTAALSNHSHGNPTLVLTNLTGTTASASNGFTLSLSGNAAQTAQTQSNIQALYDGANSISTGTIRVTDANGVSWSVNGQTLSASVRTNYASSSHSHGDPTLALTNISGTTASASNGFTLSLSVALPVAQSNQTIGILGEGNTTVDVPSGTLDARSFYIKGMGIISVGYSLGSLILSVPAGGGAGDGVNILAAGTQTANTTGSVLFGTAGNVTFGMSNSSVITANAPTQTVQSLGMYFLSNTTGETSSGTFDARTISFRAYGGLSMGWSNSSIVASMPSNYLTTAALSNHSHGNPTLALTNINGTTASASNGLTLSLSVAAPVVQTNQTMGWYATVSTTGESSSSTFDARSLTLKGFGMSIGYSNGSIIFSNPAGGAQSEQTQNIIRAIYDGANSITSGTVRFTNANGVTFSFNGQTLSASVQTNYQAPGAYLTTAALSDHSHGNPTLALTNLTGTTASASNGFTLSLSAANPGGGAGATLSEYAPIDGTALLTNSVLGQNSLYFVPFDIIEAVNVYRLNLFGSVGTVLSASNNTGSGAITISCALYTRGTGVSTDRINSLWSGSLFMGFTNSSNTRIQVSIPVGIVNSTSFSLSTMSNASSNVSTYFATSIGGFRALWIPVSSTLTPGRYWFAYASSRTSANAQHNIQISMGQQTIGNQIAYRPFGVASAASNASFYGVNAGMGTYSATSGAFPATIALTTNIILQPVVMTIPYFNFSGYTTNTNLL